MDLPKKTAINKYIIKQVKDKQLPYKSIYALSPIKLKILKTYIKIHFKTSFIWPFKSLAEASILFDKKLADSFYLCVNY